MMKMSRHHHDPSVNGPTWDFLAEIPLNELLTDMDLRDDFESGLLFVATRALDIPRELLDPIEMKLMGFASEAPAMQNLRRFGAPTHVRIFSQGNSLRNMSSGNSSRQNETRELMSSSHIIHHFEPKNGGGWGYFMVERGGCSQLASPGTTRNWIDLYLYREGN